MGILNVINLIEPDLCLECPFATMSNITMPDGEIQSMVRCLRRDCDNWDLTEMTIPQAIDGRPNKPGKNANYKIPFKPLGTMDDGDIPLEDSYFRMTWENESKNKANVTRIPRK